MAKDTSKHTKFLREISKFLAGLIAADAIAQIWFIKSGLLPIFIWGIEFTQEIAQLAIAFDLFLLLILINYAWHPKVLEPSMGYRKFFLLVGYVTLIAGLLHIIRLALGWDLSLGNWMIPMWLSWITAIITLYISYTSFHLRKK